MAATVLPWTLSQPAPGSQASSLWTLSVPQPGVDWTRDWVASQSWMRLGLASPRGQCRATWMGHRKRRMSPLMPVLENISAVPPVVRDRIARFPCREEAASLASGE